MRKSGDFFSIFSIISTIVLGALALYSVAAIGFAAVALVFGLVSGVLTRVFRWPVKAISIPLALRLHIGKSAVGAVIGLAFVALCAWFSIGVIREFNTPAVRRIGQGIYTMREELGKVGDKLADIAAEGIGNQRLDRWTEWIWREDMSHDDTLVHLSKEDNRLPAALFAFSDQVNAWGRALMEKVYEGEHHQWFLYAYWLVSAVVLPMMVGTFVITIFQLSMRRLFSSPGWFAAALVSLMTLGLAYCVLAALYLFPFVSHPYHTLNIPFWVATFVYTIAGCVCFAVVRANQHILFTSEETPAQFAPAASGAKKKGARGK